MRKQGRTRRIYEERWPSGVICTVMITTKGVYYDVRDVDGAVVWQRFIPFESGPTVERLRRSTAREQEHEAAQLDLERTRDRRS